VSPAGGVGAPSARRGLPALAGAPLSSAAGKAGCATAPLGSSACREAMEVRQEEAIELSHVEKEAQRSEEGVADQGQLDPTMAPMGQVGGGSPAALHVLAHVRRRTWGRENEGKK